MLLSSKKALVLSLCFFCLLTLVSYFHRNPTGDDAWFAEQAYWLHREGVIRSNFFAGVLDWDRQLLVSHKLFLAVGAAFMGLFGNTLTSFQAVGLVSFLVLLGELLYYTTQAGRSGPLPILLIALLVCSNLILVQMSFEYRPELLLAALGFGSFLLIQSPGTSFFRPVLAGVLAGLSALAHLNGAIYLMAGFLTYGALRQARNALLFGLFGALTAALYLVDIVQAENGFATWLYQFRHDPATQDALGLRSKLRLLLTYPVFFFKSIQQALFTLLVLSLLAGRLSYLRKSFPVLSFYTGFLILSFWLITKKHTSVYIPLFLPFLLAILYELYRTKKTTSVLFRLLVYGYLVVGVVGIGELIYKNVSRPYLPAEYAALSPHLTGQQRGLVPLTFYFNQYEAFPFLLCHNGYIFNARAAGQPTSPAAMARWAYGQQADFILLDYQFDAEDFYPPRGTKALPFYKLAFLNHRFAIYTRTGTLDYP